MMGMEIQSPRGVPWLRMRDQSGTLLYRQESAKGDFYARELRDAKPVSEGMDLFLGEPVGVTLEVTETESGKPLRILRVRDLLAAKTFEVFLYPGVRPKSFNDEGEEEEDPSVQGFMRVAGTERFRPPMTPPGADLCYVEARPWKTGLNVISFVVHNGEKGREHFVHLGTLEHDIEPVQIRVMELRDWQERIFYRVVAIPIPESLSSPNVQPGKLASGGDSESWI